VEADCTKSEPDVLGDSPGHVVMCYEALFDHENSAAQFDTYVSAGAAIASANGQAGSTYYMIHALRALGDQDFTYTTSLPTSAVYWNSTTGARTYLVFNPLDTTQTVTVFHNGVAAGTMSVPAHVTVSTQNVNFVATAPPTPTNAAAVAGAGQVSLTWTGSTLATSYHVRRAANAAGPFSTVATVDSATYTDGSLPDGATYYYTFSAVNSVGESADSGVLSASTTAATPTGLAGSLANGNPVLTWNASPGAASYKVQRSTTATGTYTTVGTPTSTTFTDTTAATGTTYYYTVTAVNAGGDSAASAPVSVTTIVPPAVPANLTATLGGGAIALAWTAPAGGPTGYTVKRSLYAGGPYATIGNTAATNFSDSALANGLTYHYIVTATNAGGESAASTEAFVTVIGAPALAINCGGSAAGQFAADGSFSGGTANSVTGAVDTIGYVNAAPQAVYTSNRFGNMTYTLTGLTAGTTYNVRLHFAETYWTAAGQRTFHIKINGAQVVSNFDIFAAAGGRFKGIIREFTAAANGSGQIVVQFVTVIDNAQCNGIEIRVPRPPAPTGVTATSGVAQVALNWSTSATATNYLIKRSASAAGPFTALASVTGTSFTDTGLAGGTPQYYVISSVNDGGESADSSMVSATPASRMTFGSFQQQYFTSQQIANPLISGPAADANGDGVKNLLAYAFDLNPWNPASANMPVAQVTGGYLTMSFIRRKSPTDLGYVVEVSGDLSTWNSGPTYTTGVTVAPRDANTEIVTVRDSTPVVPGVRRFIRLNVSY
jgi:fibronectin type 3 domain-containing protein